MKSNNLNLWLRLTISSAIGAIVYHLSPAPKVKSRRRKSGENHHKPSKI